MDEAEAAINRLLIRLETAIGLSERSDDYGVGYRTGLRMAMDIAEGVQQELRDPVPFGGHDEPDYA